MIAYDPKVANISREEFEELMEILRQPDEPPNAKTPDAIWRQEYRERLNRGRVIMQPDLFGGDAKVHWRKHQRRAPVIRPVETVAGKLERIKGDPSATFGPARADRPASPTPEEKQRVIAGAANWLRVGQRIRIIDAPGSVDPQFGPGRFLGREGIVWRLCSVTFADRCYVYLDPIGGERAEKIEMVELRDIEPIT